MSLKIEPGDGAKRTFQRGYSPEEVRTRVDRTIQEFLQGMKVPGYRPGRVPASYVRSRSPYMASVHEEVRRSIHAEVVGDLIKGPSETVVFLDPADFTVTEENEKSGLTVTGTIEVFSLPQNFVYEKISLSPETAPAVTKDEVESAIALLAKQGATQFVPDLPADTAAEEGDLVGFTFSFVDPVSGLARDGRQTVTVGDPRVPESLTRALIGKKAGESFTGKIPFNIPGEKKGERSRSETHEATIGVLSVRRLSPLTREELFTSLLGGKEPSEGETLESLVEAKVLEQKLTETLNRKMEELVVEVLSRNSLPVPEGRIDLEIARMKQSGMSDSEIDRERVKKDTMWWFILDELASKIPVVPSVQRVEQEFFALIQRAGSPGKNEERRNEYVEQAIVSARRRLTEEYLLRNATFSGWEDFFSPGGLLERLKWGTFGVLPAPSEQIGQAHDHDHDHDHDHNHDHAGHRH
jgi:trigger factor